MKHSNIGVFLPHLGCRHQCSFCNQQHITAAEQPPTPQEVAQLLHKAVPMLKDSQHTEVAFFGGSFTALDPTLQAQYLTVATDAIRQYGLQGIRLSTRPDAIDKETLDLLKKYPVTAIELGAQSMDDGVLLENHRGHTVEDVVKAAKLIKEYGFSLGLQMMTGLKGDSAEKSIETAQKLIVLQPQTVRIYPTVVLPHTDLATWFLQGEYTPPTVAETVPVCATLLDLFEAAGVLVIKLGLHAEQAVADNLLAGCYHPAFRELCEAERYYRRAEQQILTCGIQGSTVTLTVAPPDCSKMIGQKRENILRLQQRFSVVVQVKTATTLSPGQLQIAWQT